MMPEVEQARRIAKQWGLVGIETDIDSAIKQRDISLVKQSIQAAVQEDATLMKELDAWSKKTKTLSSLAANQGVPVSKYMAMISELQANRANWVNNKAKYIQAIQDIENDIKEAKDNEKLSTLLVDVADAKAQFGYDAVHAVYDAVEKKLAGWAGMSLQDQKKKLSFEINWVSTNQKYPTWKVAMQAYQKKLDEVEYKIEKETLEQPDLISIPTVSNLPSFIVFAKYAFIFLNLLDQLFY